MQKLLKFHPNLQKSSCLQHSRPWNWAWWFILGGYKKVLKEFSKFWFFGYLWGREFWFGPIFGYFGHFQTWFSPKTSKIWILGALGMLVLVSGLDFRIIQKSGAAILKIFIFWRFSPPKGQIFTFFVKFWPLGGVKSPKKNVFTKSLRRYFFNQPTVPTYPILLFNTEYCNSELCMFKTDFPFHARNECLFATLDVLYFHASVFSILK